MDDSRTVQWRRDASNSRTVRALWALGVGTFLAMLTLIVFWRIYDLVRGTSAQSIVVAAMVATLATVLAFALTGTVGQLARWLPVSEPTETGRRQIRDAAVGAVVMGTVVVGLMGIGRVASQTDFLGVGAGPFTGLAAATLPLALVAIVGSAFVRSVGTLDLEERRLYLYEPEEAVDLEVVDGVSVRTVGDTAIVKLAYARPDGQYVPGPRRLVVPLEVAREVEGKVGSHESAFSRRTSQLRRTVRESAVGRRVRRLRRTVRESAVGRHARRLRRTIRAWRDRLASKLARR